MSALEALIALMVVLSAAALFLDVIPRLESQPENTVQDVVDAHGLGRTTNGKEAHSFCEVVGLRSGQMHLIDAAIALMLVLATLAIGFSELKQKAFDLEDSRHITTQQLELITTSDECALNPKSNCTGDKIERIRIHS